MKFQRKLDFWTTLIIINFAYIHRAIFFQETWILIKCIKNDLAQSSYADVAVAYIVTNAVAYADFAHASTFADDYAVACAVAYHF